MNTVVKLVASSAILCFASSCTKEMVNAYSPEQNGNQIILEASFVGNNSTKTVLDSETGKVSWMPDDMINVFYGKTSVPFVSSNEEAADKAYFISSSSVMIGGLEGGTGKIDKVRALYPYDSEASCKGGVIYTSLPSEQEAVAGTFANNLFISVAENPATDGKLAFYNVTSGIRFKVNHSGINKIVIRGNDNEVLAGKIGISFSDEDPAIPYVSEVIDGCKEVVVKCDSGFKVGEWYYAVTLPGTLEKGFTISAYLGDICINSDGLDSSLSLRRGVFGSVSDVKIDWIPDNVIVYTSSDEAPIWSYYGDGMVSNTYEDGRGVMTFNAPVTSLVDWGFSGSNVKSIILPDSVTTIRDGVFSGCMSLSDILIPESVNTIGDNAFMGTKISSLVLPNSVISIGANSYAHNYKLTRVLISGSVKHIGNNAFDSCYYLTDVTLSDGITNIGDNAFAGCPITEISIPNSIDTIGSYAFYSTGLSEIVIPDSVESIGEYAMAGCGNLREATIPESIDPTLLFDGCRSLEYLNGEYLVDFLSRTTIINNRVISGASNLGGTTVPDGVTAIGFNAFFECKQLTMINIPSTVTSIDYAAFFNCVKLESIVIPERVTTIENNTFNGCSSLTSVSLPDSLIAIKTSAFADCISLAHISIPANVALIQDSAFSGCRTLDNVTVNATVPPVLHVEAFKNCYYNMKIYVPAGSVDAYKAADGWSAYADRIYAIE